MKKFLLTVLIALLISGTSFATPIPMRGVIEGFYGELWTNKNRLDLMNFCRLNNLNAYIYAPKDDPYHREKWRVSYPKSKLAELKNLVETANKNGVRFIFAISPGQTLNYIGEKGDEDFNKILRKLDSVYDIGVRNFAIFFDDLKDENGVHHEDGKLQAEFLNKLQAALREKHYDIEPLITVPTEYYRLDMIQNANNYTVDFAQTLNKRIVVLYTGDGVVCDGITNEDFQAACKIYERDLGIWWNYPVNDYALTTGGNKNSKLALGAIEKLPTTNVQAIFFNPMGQYELSKIALATGADYSNSPETYDAEKSWDAALIAQFGKLAPAMKIFASHSRHMENSWAKVGAADAPEFEAAANAVISNFLEGKKLDSYQLSVLIAEMEKSAATLLKNLPPEILIECKPQLEQFQRLAQASRLALQSLSRQTLAPQLKALREEIRLEEPNAILSEKAALKFIDDTIYLLN